MRPIRIHHRADRALCEAVDALGARGRTGDRLSDHLRAELRNGGGPDFIAATVSVDDTIVAYAQMSRADQTMLLELVGERDTITSEQLARSVIEASSWQRPIRWWIHAHDEADRPAALRLGFSPERTLLELQRDLPLEIAVDIELRTFRPGVDDQAWLALNNLAFVDHAEQSAWTERVLAQRLAEPWFDAEGFLICESNDVGHDAAVMVGFCWTKIHLDSDPLVGEIYVIGVHPDHRGRGLGRQLTIAGLDRLQRSGAEIAMLFTDEDNRAAVAMYRDLGFTTVRTHEAMILDPDRAAAR
jgi:mycothiol synthase